MEGHAISKTCSRGLDQAGVLVETIKGAKQEQVPKPCRLPFQGTVMSNLFQLPNGSWADPAYIKYVEAAPATSSMSDIEAQIPDRVIIHIGNDRRVINCKNLNEALRLRDEIADQVNKKDPA